MYRKLQGRGGCIRPIEAWTELRTQTDRWGLAVVVAAVMVVAQGRGITVAPSPAKARLGLCAVEHTTHSSDTQKRACSQHIYILYNIYIEGYTGLYMKSSTVPAHKPSSGSSWNPWRCLGTAARLPRG